MVEPFVIGDNDVTKTLDVVVIDHEGEDEDSNVSNASKECVCTILTEEYLQMANGSMEHT